MVYIFLQDHNTLLDELLQFLYQTFLLDVYKRQAIYLADEIVVFSTRPGSIKKIIKNDLPRPRNRTSREFNDLITEVTKYIDESDIIV